MIRHLRQLFAAVADGSLKHVTVKVTRKRDGVYASVEAFTGTHTFGLSSYVQPAKKPSATRILEACGLRCRELLDILGAQ